MVVTLWVGGGQALPVVEMTHTVRIRDMLWSVPMHRVGYLLCEGFQVMALASQSVFEIASLLIGPRVYALRNFSVAGGKLRSSLRDNEVPA